MTTQNRQPVLRCVLSNAAHPEYGQVTIPFPIPGMEYERTLECLAAMELGAPLKRDCRVDELESGFPILKRLEKVGANLDELDYLARRLDSFDDYEAAQFQAMAVRLGTFDMTDFINLTFCCQQATVITDFSDLDAVGRQHYMTLEGGCASEEELEQVDGRAAALKLILNKHGTITPYGVVYDNGMELEKFYKEGGPFPDYLDREFVILLEASYGEGQSGVLVLDDLIGALEGFLTEIPRHHSQGGEHIDVLRLRTLPVKAVQRLGGDGVRPGNQFIDLPDKLFFLYILSPSVHMDSPPRDGPWLGWSLSASSCTRVFRSSGAIRSAARHSRLRPLMDRCSDGMLLITPPGRVLSTTLECAWGLSRIPVWHRSRSSLAGLSGRISRVLCPSPADASRSMTNSRSR